MGRGLPGGGRAFATNLPRRVRWSSTRETATRDRVRRVIQRQGRRHHLFALGKYERRAAAESRRPGSRHCGADELDMPRDTVDLDRISASTRAWDLGVDTRDVRRLRARGRCWRPAAGRAGLAHDTVWRKEDVAKARASAAGRANSSSSERLGRRRSGPRSPLLDTGSKRIRSLLARSGAPVRVFRRRDRTRGAVMRPRAS